MFNNEKNYYLNPKIKRAELKEEYTAEQIQEYVKCAEDPIYFIENYVEINSLDKGFVKFRTRGYQKELIQKFFKHNKNIVLSSRQSGKSITTAAFILWYIFFNPDKNVAILANKAAVAREILARIVASFERVPFFLQPGVKVLNKGSVELGNSSKIIAAATSASAIRGFSCNLLYLDEFAFVENAEEFFRSVIPTISSGNTTKVIISSTPQGLNLFHKLWKDAVDGNNDYIPTEITWDQVPGRDEAWKNLQMAQLGEHGFRQEFGNEFLGSSNTLISGYKLQSLTWEKPLKQSNSLIILEEPKENHNYVISVDSSRGVENDYSVAIVIDTTTVPYKIVARFKDNTTRPILLPNIIVDLAKKYNRAFLLIERNTVGQTVAESCYWDLEYENIFTTIQGKKGQELRSSFSKSNKIGVEMTTQVKRLGTSILKTLVEEDKLIQYTEDIVTELYSFINKSGTWGGEAGKHDDLVMALVLFSWASNQLFFKEITNSDLRKSFLTEQSEAEEEIYSFAGISDGSEIEEIDNSWLF
jgi:Terminase RNaseH-like domain/Terminase large subunit, T4likevirus-type, N-terminal